ncbi:MAG: hypothetical protein J5J00_01190 [Deltaproteobacteria bacterium]|nr:hypothetical protein [Deltaproteobacteria bacterium]
MKSMTPFPSSSSTELAAAPFLRGTESRSFLFLAARFVILLALLSSFMMAPLCLSEEQVIRSASVEAGSLGYTVSFKVRSKDKKAITREVSLKVLDLPAWIKNLKVSPEVIDQIAPGKLGEFTVSFDVAADLVRPVSSSMVFGITSSSPAEVSPERMILELSAQPTLPRNLRLASVNLPESYREDYISLERLSNQAGFVARQREKTMAYKGGGSEDWDDMVTETAVAVTKFPTALDLDKPFSIEIGVARVRSHPEKHYCRSESESAAEGDLAAVEVAVTSDLGSGRYVARIDSKSDLISRCLPRPRIAAEISPEEVKFVKGKTERQAAVALVLNFTPEREPEKGGILFKVSLSSDGKLIRESSEPLTTSFERLLMDGAAPEAPAVLRIRVGNLGGKSLELRYALRDGVGENIKPARLDQRFLGPAKDGRLIPIYNLSDLVGASWEEAKHYADIRGLPFRKELAGGAFNPAQRSLIVLQKPEANRWAMEGESFTVWYNGQAGGAALDRPGNDTPQLDCSTYPGTVSTWLAAKGKFECICPSSMTWVAEESRCRDRVQVSSERCAKAYPNSAHGRFKANEIDSECDCLAGYAWNVARTACVPVGAAANEKCQRDYPNSVFENFDPSNGMIICNCLSGYVWNKGKTACVTAQANCYQYPGTVPVFNAATGAYDCNCPRGQTWSGGRCISNQEWAQSDCGRRFPGTTAVWNQATGLFDCNCIGGTVWSGNRCVYPQRQPAAPPPPAAQQPRTDCVLTEGMLRVAESQGNPQIIQMYRDQLRAMGCRVAGGGGVSGSGGAPQDGGCTLSNFGANNCIPGQ